MGNLCGGPKQNKEPKREKEIEEMVQKTAATQGQAVEASAPPKSNLPPGLQNSVGKKKKLNRADFMFKDKEGETLIKRPGDINGIDFAIKDLKNCTVFLLDHIAQI